MGDKPPANPDDLTAAAKTFYAAAEELRRIHTVLTNRTQDLVNGSDAWSGSASEQFQAAWERFGDDTLSGATTLERTANVLNALAIAIQNVQASPAGKLVRAIDAGHVKVVPHAPHVTIANAGFVSGIVNSSDAASASTAVSDGYVQAATNGAIGFDGAAHATSGAHLAGGVSSSAVGISQTGWSAGPQSAAGQSAASAAYAETNTDATGTRANGGRKSDAAAPVAPGIFTSATSGDGASGRAASFATGDDAAAASQSSAEDGADTGADNGKADGQGKTRTYTRADLGGSPSDTALAAARQQGSTTSSAWA